MKTEPAKSHMNYLNGDYAPDAVSTWPAGGCYATIQRKLGYRFQVRAWSTHRPSPQIKA